MSAKCAWPTNRHATCSITSDWHWMLEASPPGGGTSHRATPPGTNASRRSSDSLRVVSTEASTCMYRCSTQTTATTCCATWQRLSSPRGSTESSIEWSGLTDRSIGLPGLAVSLWTSMVRSPERSGARWMSPIASNRRSSGSDSPTLRPERPTASVSSANVSSSWQRSTKR